LLQHPDDLLLREPALPHLLSSSGFYTLENSRLHWYCFRGAGQVAFQDLRLAVVEKLMPSGGFLANQFCEWPLISEDTILNRTFSYPGRLNLRRCALLAFSPQIGPRVILGFLESTGPEREAGYRV